jgi:hypothetical protein
MVPGWYRQGADLVQGWYRHGTSKIPGWCRDGTELVLAWRRADTGRGVTVSRPRRRLVLASHTPDDGALVYLHSVLYAVRTRHAVFLSRMMGPKV